MRPLLWKEMRDLRPWILAGAAVTLALALLRLTHLFDGSFATLWTLFLMPISVAAAAIGLGVGQVAGERHAKTLDFLLVRPVAAGAVVWSKFITGSVVLSLLVTAAVALGYADKESVFLPGVQTIEDVGLVRLLVALFPRFWCLYALALLCSVLVDRASKAWALAAGLVIAMFTLALVFAEVAPFSGFVYWLPYFESSGALMEVASSWRFAGITGLVCAAGAVLLTAASAKLLERSPERYLGNRALALVAVCVIGLGVASANIAADRLPELASAGSWEWQADDQKYETNVLASGRQVALSMDERVHFFDFTDPARPRQVAEVTTPLWQSLTDRSINRAAMEDGTLFRVGQKKQLPVDDLEIAIVKPGSPVDAISLGPVHPEDFVSAPIPVAPFVFVGIAREGACSIHAFDITSKREVASVPIDTLSRPPSWHGPFSPPVQLVRRGAYLYITSPSYLTTLDITNPANPVVTSQLPLHPNVALMLVIPRPLAWQGNRLVEVRAFPETLASYDLRDPAHPVEAGEFLCRSCEPIDGAGQHLYRPWQSGLMEFSVEQNGPHFSRYLPADRAISSFVTSGDFVYALTRFDLYHHRNLQAFYVGR